MVTPFDVMNALGVLAFAVAGALVAVEEDLDALGVAVLGVVTALGGGITRDVLVARVPVALTATSDVTLALVGVPLGVAFARHELGNFDSPVLLLPDAVGLAAFATSGAIVGWEAGVSPFGVVVTATLTGVGGGAIRDVLVQRVPSVLREDFYATCALAGGVAFWTLRTAGAPRPAGVVACVTLVLGLRLLAIRYDWHLPTVG